jgi:hypothetical protein
MNEQRIVSVSAISRAPSERIVLAAGERIISVAPGFNGRLVVYIESPREPAAPEDGGDRTTAGERAVTEEVSP